MSLIPPFPTICPVLPDMEVVKTAYGVLNRLWKTLLMTFDVPTGGSVSHTRLQIAYGSVFSEAAVAAIY
jgi:hypothetical protein